MDSGALNRKSRTSSDDDQRGNRRIREAFWLLCVFGEFCVHCRVVSPNLGPRVRDINC
jgi:hypothetical protein